MSAPPFHRFPGPGDLPGDSRNPNSPDYVEPSYGLDDAQGDVANQLIEADEVAELVADVHEGLAVLQWACEQTNVPRYLQSSLRVLRARAMAIDRMVSAQVGVMS